MRRKFHIALIVVPLALCTGVLGLFLFVITGLSGPLPSRVFLRHVHRPVASAVFAADGSVFGNLYLENRLEIPLSSCPAYLKDALLATEDVRFYGHHGIDFKSLGRVIVKSILLSRRSAGGGSTITQQLAKNLFPREQYMLFSTPVQKMRECIVARRIESVFTKEEILERYLNTVSFGENTFGIASAAQRFFNKQPKSLQLEEAALLVGMLKAPTYYSPRRFPERAAARRNIVLDQMVKYGRLDPGERDSLAALPVLLNYHPDERPSELSGYFLAHVQKQVQSILAELGDSIQHLDVRVEGLKIYTTIDARLQQHAVDAIQQQMPRIQQRFDNEWRASADWETPEWYDAQVQSLDIYRQMIANGTPPAEVRKKLQETSSYTVFNWDPSKRTREMSVLDSLKYYKRILQTGFFAVDPFTGYVKAWVGGIDHNSFPYDHILARRQPGSTFKPILYAAAIESGVDPCHYYNNSKVTLKEFDWSPDNADSHYGGSYSLTGGLVHSVNTVAAQVLQDVGIAATRDLARRMGIRSSIPAVPSIALGTGELQLDEITTAYSAFVNGGMRVTPVTVLKIENSNGVVLYEYTPIGHKEQVLSDSVSKTILDMLQLVVDTGTAQSLRTRFDLTTPLGGKTGTTQNHTHGWYIGISPALVAGVWVGADDPAVHFKTLSSGQGASTALLIYGQFMRDALRDPAFVSWKSHHFDELSGKTRLFDCPLYTPLSAEEMEALRESDYVSGEHQNPIVRIFKSLFSSTHPDPEQEKRRLLTQMQKQLDRTASRLEKRRIPPGEIRRQLDEIRKEYYARIEELTHKNPDDPSN